MSRTNCLGAMLIVAFAISGCQTSNKWTTAWKERTKPKPKFQGVEGPEEVTYWPYKSDKSNPKMTAMPSQLKEKLATKTQKNKYDKELASLITEGDHHRKSAHYEEARLVYAKALLLSPDNPDVNHRLAIVADMERQYSLADDYYRAALRVNPRDVDVLSDYGYSYILRGNSQQAEITLKEALQIDPSHKGAMANLGTIYAQQNRYNEAVAMFRAGATEADAQKYLAKLFPYGRSLGSPGPHGNDGTAQPATQLASNRDNQPDLSKLSFDQIQAEMARRKIEGEKLRAQADLREEARLQRAQADFREFEKHQAIADSTTQSPQHNAPAQQRLAASGANYSRANSQNGQPAPATNDALASANLQPGLDAGQRQPGVQPPASPNAAAQGNMAFDTQSFGQRPQPDRSVAATPGQYTGTEVYRGTGSQVGQNPVAPARGVDPQIQRAWNGQMAGATGNEIQQAGNLTSAAQTALELGMSAGPGGMFPIVQSNISSSSPVTDASNGFDQRFGAEFQSPPQSATNWSNHANDVARGPNAHSTGPADVGLTAAPPSPAGGWGNFNMEPANPQSHSHDASWWNGDAKPAGGPTNGGNDSRAGDSGMNRIQPRQADGFDLIQSEIGAAVRGRQSTESSRPVLNEGIRPVVNEGARPVVNEGTRPYNGSWPSSNSLPPRQSQNSSSVNRSSNGWEVQTGNLPMNNSGDYSEIQEPGPNVQPANSLPQWPYARNR